MTENTITDRITGFHQTEATGKNNHSLDLESRIAALAIRVSDDKSELGDAISAEIRTRRSKEDDIVRNLTLLDQRLATLERLSKRQAPEKITTTIPLDTRIADNTTDNRFRISQEEIENRIQQHLKQLMTAWEARITELKTEIRADRERKEKLYDFTRKSDESRISELKRQFAILHTEVVEMQLRIPKLKFDQSPEFEHAAGAEIESNTIHQLAQSILTMKLALTIKIKALENRIGEYHEQMEADISKFKELEEHKST